jgi:hypothetical protein
MVPIVLFVYYSLFEAETSDADGHIYISSFKQFTQVGADINQVRRLKFACLPIQDCKGTRSC